MEEKKKRLQILVPHYHETSEVIKPLLDSIAIQQAVDFNDIGVIICHDGGEPGINESSDLGNYYPKEDQSKGFEFYDDAGIGGNYSLFVDYPFEIRQIHIPHGGVSAARNGALDASDAEYVMFCDCDDIFYSACGIWMVFREMDYGEFDALVSEFVEERYIAEENKTLFLKHENDSTFVHGKVFRRQYLLENNIRWNPALTVHEDSYFNILTQVLSENVKYCDISFYLWKWRNESVCRHDPKYILKTYNNLIDSNEALVEQLFLRNRQKNAKFYVIMLVFDAYYAMNRQEWIEQENQEYRDATERRFAKYFRDHKETWNSVCMSDKVKVSENVRKNSVYQGMGMETMTINEWLEHIETLA